MDQQKLIITTHKKSITTKIEMKTEYLIIKLKLLTKIIKVINDLK